MYIFNVHKLQPCVNRCGSVNARQIQEQGAIQEQIWELQRQREFLVWLSEAWLQP